MIQKKVSIVLPVYNGEANLSHAIDSIINQTYQNIELIVVNDCSTDGTAEILKEYAENDSRILIINNPINMKLPRTLNAGFEHATGDYLTWTSDDNIYKEDAIWKMVEYLQSDDSIDMVYANYTRIDASGNILGEVEPLGTDMLPFGNEIGACFLYKREIAELVGFYDADAFLAEDYDYWIRIWKAGKLIRIPENLYYYRVHDKSLTSTKTDLINIQTYKVMEKHFLFLYSKLDTEKKRNLFFDRIMYHSRENETVKKRLYSINRKYAFHINRCKIKKYILVSAPVRILGKVKRRLFG